MATGEAWRPSAPLQSPDLSGNLPLTLAAGFIARLGAIADDISGDEIFYLALGRQKATAGPLNHPPPPTRARLVCAPLAVLCFCFLASCFPTDKNWPLDHPSLYFLCLFLEAELRLSLGSLRQTD